MKYLTKAACILRYLQKNFIENLTLNKENWRIILGHRVETDFEIVRHADSISKTLYAAAPSSSENCPQSKTIWTCQKLLMFCMPRRFRCEHVHFLLNTKLLISYRFEICQTVGAELRLYYLRFFVTRNCPPDSTNYFSYFHIKLYLIKKRIWLVEICVCSELILNNVLGRIDIRKIFEIPFHHYM